jgi:hypothetical protein
MSGLKLLEKLSRRKKQSRLRHSREYIERVTLSPKPVHVAVVRKTIYRVNRDGQCDATLAWRRARVVGGSTSSNPYPVCGGQVHTERAKFLGQNRRNSNIHLHAAADREFAAGIAPLVGFDLAYIELLLYSAAISILYEFRNRSFSPQFTISRRDTHSPCYAWCPCPVVHRLQRNGRHNPVPSSAAQQSCQEFETQTLTHATLAAPAHHASDVIDFESCKYAAQNKRYSICVKCSDFRDTRFVPS